MRVENFAIIHSLNSGRAGFDHLHGVTGLVIHLAGRVRSADGRESRDQHDPRDVERAILEALSAYLRALQNHRLWRQKDCTWVSGNLAQREIGGRTQYRARLRGAWFNVSLLKEVGSFLVDITAISEHLSLLTVRQHLNLLDASPTTAWSWMITSKLPRLEKTPTGLKDLRQAEQDAARMSDCELYQIRKSTPPTAGG